MKIIYNIQLRFLIIFFYCFLKEYNVESDDNSTVESENYTDLSDENEDSIAIFSRKTQVQEIYYSTVPIEYPKTSEIGVATVYNITGWKNPRDCWNNVSNYCSACISIY